MAIASLNKDPIVTYCAELVRAFFPNLSSIAYSCGTNSLLFLYLLAAHWKDAQSHRHPQRCEPT